MPTILITGGSRGIGKALVEFYKRDGWHVIATCRDPAAAQDVLADELLPLEVTSDDGILALRAAIGARPLDILWNNAGVYLDKGTDLNGTGFDAWAETFAVNSIAPLRLSAAFVENIAASDTKTIAFTSSRMGSIGDLSGAANGYAYRSSKAALNMAGAMLANDLRPRGIKTVMLHPGWVQTDMGGASADITTEVSAHGMKQIVDGLTDAQSGTFLNYDGKSWPW